MRVLVARCSIGYAGRLTTRLASGDRVIIFKDDGSVCVHGPQGFERLAATVEACDTLRLSYGDLDEAAAWFDALVQAQRRAAVDEGAGA